MSTPIPAKPTGKPVSFSGVQPSGIPSIGNLLGAFRPFVKYQDTHHAYFCVVDHHAITVRQDPKELRENTLGIAARYIAAGLNPNQCTLFIQSHVTAHAELGWILNTFTQMGELERMTQYKDKAARHTQNINAGLFTYPALMAADILLYNTQDVPVGDDQLQHIELCRDVATRFNNAYSPSTSFKEYVASHNEYSNNNELLLFAKSFDPLKWREGVDLSNLSSVIQHCLLGYFNHILDSRIFTLPKGVLPTAAARVMDLQEPTRKMSKSQPGPGTILLNESPAEAAKKIKRAQTDSLGVIKFDRATQPGIANLLEMLGALSNRTPQEVAKEFENQQYGALKSAVAEAVVFTLEPLQARYNELMGDKAELLNILKSGAAKADEVASQTLAKVKEHIGYIAR